MFTVFSTAERDIKKYWKIVSAVNAQEKELANLTNDELRAYTRTVVEKISAETNDIINGIKCLQAKLGPDLDAFEVSSLYKQLEDEENKFYEKSEIVLKKYLPAAFAILKSTCSRFAYADKIEVTATEFDNRLAEERDYISIIGAKAIYKRSWMAGGKEIIWNMIPYDHQILAGIGMQYGHIIEMLNGEGKTLAAIFPLFLNALANRKVHICTANAFLSNRDYQWMRPLLEFHGVTVSEIDVTPEASDKRKKAYKANIIYGTANEFGFDYLRDNMVTDVCNILQASLDFVLIDEVDSILIDEARTPLTMSGSVGKKDGIIELYKTLHPLAAEIVKAQQLILDDFFIEARTKVKEDKYDSAVFYLYLIKRGDPKHIDFHNYINTTPKVLSYLNRFLKKVEDEHLEEEINNELYFVVDNGIEFTEKGKALTRQISGDSAFWELPDLGEGMSSIENEKNDVSTEISKKKELIDSYEFVQETHHILSQIVKAYVLYFRDTDYIVMNNRVCLIDDVTGRLLKGRSYSEGLHQALEVKENVPLSRFTQSLGTISFQSYFRKYRKLAGMTATAGIDKREYKIIYDKEIIVIPPSKPTIRKDFNDIVYRSKKEKLEALIDEVKKLVASNRPVLINTVTVEDSDLISSQLSIHQVSHQVLNAKYHESEALIITQAGIARTVTVAAKMAGRGTDIKLTQESILAGGLAVLGFERNETRRWDVQLKGRAGRQGDPGTTQFFISLEDKLMRMFGSDKIAKLMEHMGYKEGDMIQHSMITNSVIRAQKQLEESELNGRSRLYQYDHSLNLAREDIYQKRKNALQGHRIKVDLAIAFDNVSTNVVQISGKSFEKFNIRVQEVFNYNTRITEQEYQNLSEKGLVNTLSMESYNIFASLIDKLAATVFQVISRIRETQPSHIENVVIPFTGKSIEVEVISNIGHTISTEGKAPLDEVQTIIITGLVDKHWIAFLKTYDKTREDVSLITAVQKADPLILFKEDITNHYLNLVEEMNYEIVTNLCYLTIKQ